MKNFFYGHILAVLVGFIIAGFCLTGCASMGLRHGEKTAQKYYAEDRKSGVWVSPLKNYGYHFMRGWERYKLLRAREEREYK